MRYIHHMYTSRRINDKSATHFLKDVHFIELKTVYCVSFLSFLHDFPIFIFYPSATKETIVQGPFSHFYEKWSRNT